MFGRGHKWTVCSQETLHEDRGRCAGSAFETAVHAHEIELKEESRGATSGRREVLKTEMLGRGHKWTVCSQETLREDRGRCAGSAFETAVQAHEIVLKVD